MAEACAERGRDADRHLSRARGSTRTSTSGSATPTISEAGASWPRRARRSTRRGRRRRRGRLAQAREEMLIAEGSDWFWWYGDDHSSAPRRRVRRSVPPAPAQRLPAARPAGSRRAVRQQHLRSAGVAASRRADGAASRRRSTARRRATSNGWAPGAFEAREAAGAMHQSERRAGLLTLVQFGFDRERLYVRVDAARRLVDLLAAGWEISLKFLQPAGVRFSVRGVLGRVTGHYWDRGAGAAGDAAAWVSAAGRCDGRGRVDSRGGAAVDGSLCGGRCRC